MDLRDRPLRRLRVYPEGGTLMDRDFVEPFMPVSEQAAAWFFELVDGPTDRGTRREFVRWLKGSPAHIHAFLAIALVDHDLARLTWRGRPPRR